ncbi:MAG: cyanate transporter [Taibaiella sp.]|jgi:CP family cyanate transporter-like MFS transporter
MIKAQRTQWAMILALVLVGLNLRPSMAGIGPLVNAVQTDISTSYSMLSLLTTLPVLVMGFAMLYGMRFAIWFGERRCVALGLMIIAIANFARFYTDDMMDLILTAVIAGVGIAIIQSVIPTLIKKNFVNSVPLFMGVYVSAIMGGAALAASTVTYIEIYLHSWRATLAIWSILAAVAFSIWLFVFPDTQKSSLKQTDIIKYDSLVRNPRAWLLGIFFGLNTSAYTCVLAWLPAYYLEQSWQSTRAGLLLAFVTFIEVIAGLTIPAIANKKKDRRPILFFLIFSLMIGFIGLMFAPIQYSLLWAGLLGLGIGGLFPMSLIVAMDQVESASGAGQLTSFVQGIGYLIAGCAPFFAAYIRDASSSFYFSWLLLIMMSIIMIAMAPRFSPR